MKTNNNRNITPVATVNGTSPPTTGKNGSGNYGSSDLAKSVDAIVSRPLIEPEMNKPALRAIAVTSGRSGEPAARELAARGFSGENNQHVEEIHGILEFLNQQIAGVGRHLKEISAGMTPGDRYIRSHVSGTPWTTADQVKCGFLITVSVLLILIGMNTIATALKASGNPAFEHSISAYLFSGIPVALAAGLKAMTVHINDEKRRRLYIIIIWIIGFAFGALWAYQFAQTFRGLTQTTAEIIRDLIESNGNTNTPESNTLFVFTAIISEAFLSAGCWVTAIAISEKHQLEKLTDNPAHLKRQSDLDRWGTINQEYVQLRGQLNGKLQAIENKSHAYIEEVLGFYRAAVKASSDNQHLDDFLGS